MGDKKLLPVLKYVAVFEYSGKGDPQGFVIRDMKALEKIISGLVEGAFKAGYSASRESVGVLGAGELDGEYKKWKEKINEQD